MPINNQTDIVCYCCPYRFERVLDPTLLIPASVEGEQENTSHSNKLLPMTLSELAVEKFDQHTDVCMYMYYHVATNLL